ncbi:hypothetical protein AQUCO_02400013v1 [Aquilegia coerulea]|uniref:Uncharacterized protein n=1 Tax=Aquilegia coerulea TaxID=218851 RepID=A0A2G5DBP9_AQUCA|nr:hypothetical protein AQUCO_02400013v1 [Aquilegia coerulea]
MTTNLVTNLCQVKNLLNLLLSCPEANYTVGRLYCKNISSSIVLPRFMPPQESLSAAPGSIYFCSQVLQLN